MDCNCIGAESRSVMRGVAGHYWLPFAKSDSPFGQQRLYCVTSIQRHSPSKPAKTMGITLVFRQELFYSPFTAYYAVLGSDRKADNTWLDCLFWHCETKGKSENWNIQNWHATHNVNILIPIHVSHLMFLSTCFPHIHSYCFLTFSTATVLAYHCSGADEQCWVWVMVFFSAGDCVTLPKH